MQFFKNGRKEEKKRAFLDREGFEHVNKTCKCSKILKEKGLIEKRNRGAFEGICLQKAIRINSYIMLKTIS